MALPGASSPPHVTASLAAITLVTPGPAAQCFNAVHLAQCVVTGNGQMHTPASPRGPGHLPDRLMAHVLQPLAPPPLFSPAGFSEWQHICPTVLVLTSMMFWLARPLTVATVTGPIARGQWSECRFHTGLPTAVGGIT